MTLDSSAIVVVVDRLGAGFLGPYGNTWIDTPALNHLASQSLLLENALADSPKLDSAYRSYWQGLHGCYKPNDSSPSPSLPKLLAEAGYDTTLLTDEVSVARHPLAKDFSRCVHLTPAETTTAAPEVSQTQMAHTLAATLAASVEQIQAANGPFLVWAHLRGMAGPWDAPTELRWRLADDEDPPPGDFVQPPHKQFEGEADPDELLGYAQAYAAQVLALDTCLAAMLLELETIASSANMMLIFTSPRGYPLGEHGRVGPCDEALYSELLHVPWLIRLPDARGAAQRCHELVQGADMFATLTDWFGLSQIEPTPCSKSLLSWLSDQTTTLRDRACSSSRDQLSMRTASWFSRHANGQNELFAKPDDRWEVNEVSARCGDIADQMAVAAQHFALKAAEGGNLELPSLPELLVHGLD